MLIGLVLLAQGLLLGEAAFPLMALIPMGAVGGLLVLSGLELALWSRPQEYRGDELFVVLVVAAVGVAANAAAGFALGLAVAYALRRGLVRL